MTTTILAAPSRKRYWFVASIVATIATMALVARSGRDLDIVPNRIVALELAGTSGAADGILKRWSVAGLTAVAERTVVLDYLFLLSYGTFLTLAVRRLAWTKTVLDGWIWPAQIIAAASDGLENVGLLQMLHDGATTFWAPVTTFFATLKFVLIGAGLVYLIVGGVVLLARRLGVELARRHAGG